MDEASVDENPHIQNKRGGGAPWHCGILFFFSFPTLLKGKDEEGGNACRPMDHCVILLNSAPSPLKKQKDMWGHSNQIYKLFNIKGIWEHEIWGCEMLECPKCGGRINTMLFSVRWILASEKKMKTAVLLPLSHLSDLLPWVVDNHSYSSPFIVLFCREEGIFVWRGMKFLCRSSVTCLFLCWVNMEGSPPLVF